MKTTAVATIALATLGQVAQAHCAYASCDQDALMLMADRHLPDAYRQRSQGCALPEHPPGPQQLASHCSV
jgi:hypothetical protein